METARMFENGRSCQAIQDPAEDVWQTFINGINSFTDDCFKDGRPAPDDAALEIRDEF